MLNNQNWGGKVFRELDKILSITGGPPVDAPIATTFTWPLVKMEYTGLLSGRGYLPAVLFQRRITFTSDISFTVVICSRHSFHGRGARPHPVSNDCERPGLYCPERGLQFSRIRAALTITIGAGLVSMIVRVASNPSISGILISIVTMSGLFRHRLNGLLCRWRPNR